MQIVKIIHLLYYISIVCIYMITDQYDKNLNKIKGLPSEVCWIIPLLPFVSECRTREDEKTTDFLWNNKRRLNNSRNHEVNQTHSGLRQRGSILWFQLYFYNLTNHATIFQIFVFHVNEQWKPLFENKINKNKKKKFYSPRKLIGSVIFFTLVSSVISSSINSAG